jgi:hypothetical protein
VLKLIARCGSESDNLQLGSLRDSGENLIDPGHDRVLEPVIVTRSALQDRQVTDHDNGAMTQLEREVGGDGFKDSAANVAFHGMRLRVRKSGSHSFGSGRYAVTIRTFPPGTSAATTM